MLLYKPKNMADSRFERVCEVVQQEMTRLLIPGVAVGVMYNGSEERAGFGVTSIEYPMPVTGETLYQIGSITKTYVGTAVMRLVEMGKLALDTPLKTYLPDLKLQDAQATENATLLHCLTHTGGWEGDYFDDFGRGEDALARMVVAVGDLPQLTPLGQLWSYNNAGFYLAGRVIEVVTGKPFEAAMREMVFEPLGLTNTYFFAEDVITYNFAVGHDRKDNHPVVARPWALARTANAAGGIICNLHDLFRYARFHMGDGTAPDGTRLLSRDSLAAMQTPRFRATDPQSVCLTWYMREVNGTRMYGHGGGTNGQVTNFQILPEKNLAFAILTNGDQGTLLVNAVTREILEQYLFIRSAEDKPQQVTESQLQPYVGFYDAALDSVDVTVQNGTLMLQVTDKGRFPLPSSPPSPTQPPPVRAAFYQPDKILLQDDPFKDASCEFLRNENKEIEWLRIFGRIHKRT